MCGTEAPLHRFPLIELRAADLTPATEEMPGRQARPFDLWRTTGVVGEGSCMFVIEAEDSVRPGYSYVRDMDLPTMKGTTCAEEWWRRAKLAMAQAHVRASDIEILTRGARAQNDRQAEVRAMRQLLGSAPANVAAVSIKGRLARRWALRRRSNLPPRPSRRDWGECTDGKLGFSGSGL